VGSRPLSVVSRQLFPGVVSSHLFLARLHWSRRLCLKTWAAHVLPTCSRSRMVHRSSTLTRLLLHVYVVFIVVLETRPAGLAMLQRPPIQRFQTSHAGSPLPPAEDAYDASAINDSTRAIRPLEWLPFSSLPQISMDPYDTTSSPSLKRARGRQIPGAASSAAISESSLQPNADAYLQIDQVPFVRAPRGVEMPQKTWSILSLACR